MNAEDLETFREEWVSELNKKVKESHSESSRYEFENINSRLTSEKRNAIEYSRLSDGKEIEKSRVCTLEKDEHYQEATGTLDSRSRCAKLRQKKKSRTEDKISYVESKWPKLEVEENFLEILIADIDELVSLPFFDLELPREIAIKIFQYLSIKDLGNCACVNTKWKILADDDLIWFDLCSRHRFVNEDSCALDREGWKEVFREKSHSAKCFHQNWKERICQISELEYEKGGILYAASVFNNSIIAGYANGLIKLWDIFSEKPTASFGMLLSEAESDRNSSITHVHGNNFIAAAGFTNGDVKVWQNGLDFPLVESFNFESKIDSLCIAARSASLVASSGSRFRIVSADENGCWGNVFQTTLDQNIKSVYLYDGNDCPSMIHTQNYVDLFGKDGLKHQLESLDDAISAEISAVFCNEGMIALGITPWGYSILDGYRIKVFSTENGRLMNLLKGPQCKIFCLSTVPSNSNIFTAGCSDMRIRMHDARLERSTMSLKGLVAVPCSLQVDEWKVIAGDMKGFISVWDQRTQSLLWQTSMRHPVRICQLLGPCLVCVSIPIDRNPKETLWYMDDLIQHRRHRGAIRIYDFTVDNSTTGIPDICQSTYDDYAGYNYNINLAMPYDVIDT